MNHTRPGIRFTWPREALLAIAATLLLGLLAIDRQSLWLDELGTWRLTVADSWSDWLAQLLGQTRSNVQMPLYHLFMRAWTQVFSTSELALRAANLPWLFLGFLALLRAPVPDARRRTALLIAAALWLHPMVWYYANEARPYAMMFAGAALAGSALLQRLDGDGAGRTRADRMAWPGLVLLAWTSPVGLVWVPAFAIPLLVLGRGGPPSAGSRAPAIGLRRIIGSALVLLAGVYYVSTHLRGVEPTTLHEHRLVNFAFGLYEIAGLGGIGPGREELRVLGLSAMTNSFVPLLFAAASIGLVAAMGLIRRFRNDPRSGLVIFGSAALSLAILFALAAIAHWRAVGRHLLPLIWFFALAIASGAGRPAMGGVPGRLRRFVPIALGCLAFASLAASSLEVAIARRHEREDYRRASEVALAEWSRGGIAWWVAAPFGASYYGLDPALRESAPAGKDGRMRVLLNPESRELADLPSPDAVLLSRPDTYDSQGAVSDYLRRYGYRRDTRLTGFEVWTR